MIITDKFVYIHQPKTGGTFVIRSLAQFFGINNKHSVERDYKKPLDLSTSKGEFIVSGKKHAKCREIDPGALRFRTILTNIRNPLDQYVSQYKFGWWKREERVQDYISVENFSKRFPSFPELSFPEFLKLQYDAYIKPAFGYDFEDPSKPGINTFKFIQFYSLADNASIRNYISSKINQVDFHSKFFEVDYLRTHKLNQDLFAYMANLGYPEKDLEFILSKKRVLPLGKGRKKSEHWKDFYDDELLELILEKDSFLFDRFPEFKEQVFK